MFVTAKLNNPFTLLFFLLIIQSCKGPVIPYREVPQPAAPGRLIIKNVTIVNPYNGALQKGADILIQDGKIMPAGTVLSHPQVIDATGQFAVPGYLDMHIHVMNNADPAIDLGLMLANGITGFRQMNGFAQLLDQRKKDSLPIAANEPRLLAMPGELLTPVNAGSAKEARKTVQQQKAAGADFIKIALVTSKVFYAVLAEAKRVGIPAVGHVPGSVDMVAASDSGIHCVEHLGLDFDGLTVCSTEKDALLEEAPGIPGVLKFMPSFMGNAMMNTVRKKIINPQAGASHKEYIRVQQILATYNEEKAVSTAKEYVKNDTWQVPTLIRLRSSMLAFLPEFENDTNLRYVPAATVKEWKEITGKYKNSLDTATQALLQKGYAMDLQLVKLYDEQGVKMMAGSDAVGAGWLIPGFSLHKEFDELEKAGVSPLHVLQMATLNGALFLGDTNNIGSLDAGKVADIVLLTANPLESVQHLHKMSAVVRGGYYYGQKALDDLKKNALNR